MSISKPPFGIKPNYAHPQMKGLIGWWLFNEGSGGQAYDSSLNRNTGELKNMAFPPIATSGWGAGRNGEKGLKFDGTNDYVDVGDSSILRFTSGNFSLSAWTYVKSTSQQMFLFHGKGGVAWGSWFLSIGGNETEPQPGKYAFGFGTASGPTNRNVYSIGSATTGSWVYLTAVYDGSNLYLYKNGVLDNSAAGTGNPWNNTVNTIIGGDPAGTPRDILNGSIDDVRIYNRALSAEEIKQLYEDPYGMFNGSKLVLSDLIGAPVVANGGFFQFM